MRKPLVSIIVIGYNHAPYIREAVHSVFSQTYNNIELIVVDDASQDDSLDVINSLEEEGLSFDKILHPQNQGYCKAFNHAFTQARGDFIIDLAADDVLLPTRVETGVGGLLDSSCGVDFCDVFYIDQFSQVVGTHFKRDSRNNLQEQVPSGDIFKDLLERYFICAPGMMMSRRVLEELEGYDEDLFYEDFDFWVRSSRKFHYHFTDEILVKKRVVPDSMSKFQYLPNSKMLSTTVKVCYKAHALCNSTDEFKALAKRIKYEMRQAVFSNNLLEARELHNLLSKIERKTTINEIWSWAIARELDLSFMSNFIRKAR